MNLHNKTYMQDNKATLAALTGALAILNKIKETITQLTKEDYQKEGSGLAIAK